MKPIHLLRRFLRNTHAFLSRLRPFQKSERSEEVGELRAKNVPGIRKLEPRRVLSVNAAFAAGVLDVVITDDGGSTDAALLVDTDDTFFVDADGDHTYDDGSSGGAAELRGLISELTRVQITGDEGDGNFIWEGDFLAASMVGNAVEVVDVSTIELNPVLKVEGDVELSAVSSIRLGGNLSVDGNLDAAVSEGSITNSAAGALFVGGIFQADAQSIDLGSGRSDHLELRGVNVSASENVVLDTDNGADSQLVFFGINDATGWTIHSDGEIIIDGQINADGDVSMLASDILMEESANIQTGNGTITLEADGKVGRVVLAQVESNSELLAIDIHANGDISDAFGGSAGLSTPNILAANGQANLVTSQGSIGSSEAALILQTAQLSFTSGQDSFFEDVEGGLELVGDLSAGGELTFHIHSPLVISSNIVLFGSATFTASGSGLAGDSITINNNAVVSLNSATASTLTFNAGDDIVFDTGRIETSGANHTVVLNSDTEGAGVADGDRGSILANGPGVAVATDTLNATAAEGIELDINVNLVNAASTVAGNIILREIDDVQLQNIVTNDGDVELTIGGAFFAVMINAQGTGSVDIFSGGAGMVFGVIGSVQAANDVDIEIASGDAILASVVALSGSVDVLASDGDILTGIIRSGTDTTAIATLGSILDIGDDSFVDVRALGDLRLEAAGSINSGNANQFFEIDVDGTVSVESTGAGDVWLHSLDSVVLQTVATNDGAIRVLADGTIQAIEVDASNTNSLSNLIELTSTSGDVEVASVLASSDADVSIFAMGSILDLDGVVDDLDVAGNSLALTAMGGSIGTLTGTVFKPTLDAIEILSQTGTSPGGFTATAIGSVVVHGNVSGGLNVTSPLFYFSSDDDIDASGLIFSGSDLSLIADADGDASGTLTLPSALAVTNDLRLEGANVFNGGVLDLSAGRLLFNSGSAANLRVSASGGVDLSAGGDLSVSSADPNLSVVDFDCDNVALQSTNSTGSISLAVNGSIFVHDDVIVGNDALASSSGSLALQTLAGSGGDIFVHDAVLVDDGNLEIDADGSVFIQSAAVAHADDGSGADDNPGLFSSRGNIGISTLTGHFFQQDGLVVIAGRDTSSNYDPGTNGNASPSTLLLNPAPLLAGQAQLSVSAEANVTLASLQSAAINDAISVTSRSGGIRDGGDADLDLVANFDNANSTLLAESGIGDSNALELSLHSLSATNSGSTGSIFLDEVAPGGDLILGVVHNDAASGDVVVNVAAGSLTLITSLDASGGHVSLVAANDIYIDGSISISGTGTLCIVANNAVDLDAPTGVDGINITGSIASSSGDVLLDSAKDLSIVGTITTGSGDIALDSDADTLVDGTVAGGAGVLVLAGNDLVMAASSNVSATGNLVLDIDGQAQVASLSGASVGATIAGDLSDQNGSGLNFSASNLWLDVSGAVGASAVGNGLPDSNLNAIDIAVDTIALQALASVYLRQTTGSLNVGAVGPANVSAQVSHIATDGSSSTVSRSLTSSGGSDVSTNANQAVKLVVDSGDLILNDGDSDGQAIDVSGDADILLRASGDIATNASVTSGTGNVTVEAGDDIDLNSALSTGGSGTVYLLAGNAAADAFDGISIDAPVMTAAGDILAQSAGDILTTANVTSTGGDIGLVADHEVTQNSNIQTGDDVLVSAGGDYVAASGNSTTANNILATVTGDIRLGLLNATDVSLDAGGDILDNNGLDTANVQATSLRMVAGGLIGGADAANGTPDSNADAIDLEVSTLAAQAANGIYVQELSAGGDLTIDHVDALTVTVDVNRVRFNSTTTNVLSTETLAALDDLTTTADGSIKVNVAGGSLAVNDGMNSDGVGVSADGTGDILLRASVDIATNASVTSGTGNVTVEVGDDIDLNAALSTGGNGTVYLLAGNAAADAFDGISIDAALMTASGDILVQSAADILTTADVTSTGGDIGLVADNDVTQNSNVQTGGDVLVSAGGDYVAASGNSTTASNILASVSGDIRLGLLNATDVSLDAGGDILDNNGLDTANVQATSLRMVAGGLIGGADAA
ncbi:MAG: hypothetical protein AAF483_03625, partial [Planctomycetota bacterium]